MVNITHLCVCMYVVCILTDDEPKDSSPSVPPSSRGQQHLRKPPKEPVGGQDPLHYHRGGPPQPGPQPQGLYHQRRGKDSS